MNTVAISDSAIRGSPEPRQVGRPPEPVGASDRARRGRAPEGEPSPELVKLATEGTNSFLRSSGSHIQFAFHDKAKELMVEVIDDATKEVIKTIPPKELLDLAAKIGDLVGALLDRRE